MQIWKVLIQVAILIEDNIQSNWPSNIPEVQKELKSNAWLDSQPNRWLYKIRKRIV